MPSDSDNIEKYRIIQAEDRFSDADLFIRTFRIQSWEATRSFIRNYMSASGPEFMSLLRKTRTWEGAGKQPFECNDGNGDWLEDILSMAMHRFRTDRLDDLSFIGSITSPFSKRGALPWDLPKDRYYLMPFDGDGGYLTITGKPRMGKTNAGALYTEMWLRSFPGSEVLTNIPFETEHEGVRHVSTLSDLLQGVADALEAGRRWLWILDEGGVVWLRAQAMRKENIGLEKFARIVPKLHGSFIYIEQREVGVPTIIQDFAVSHLVALAKGLIYSDLEQLKGTIKDVPPAKFAYRTGGVGAFYPDVEMEDVLFNLRETGHGTQADRIREALAEK